MEETGKTGRYRESGQKQEGTRKKGKEIEKMREEKKGK